MEEKNRYEIMHTEPRPPNVYEVGHFSVHALSPDYIMPIAPTSLIIKMPVPAPLVMFHAADGHEIGRLWVEDSVLKFQRRHGRKRAEVLRMVQRNG